MGAGAVLHDLPARRVPSRTGDGFARVRRGCDRAERAEDYSGVVLKPSAARRSRRSSRARSGRRAASSSPQDRDDGGADDRAEDERRAIGSKTSATIAHRGAGALADQGRPRGTKSLNRMLQLTLNLALPPPPPPPPAAAPPPPTPPTPPPPASPACRSRPLGGAANSARRASSAWLGDTVVQLTNDTRRRCSTATSDASSAPARSAPRFRVEFETVGDIVGDGERERDSDAPPPVVDYSKANLEGCGACTR